MTKQPAISEYGFVDADGFQNLGTNTQLGLRASGDAFLLLFNVVFSSLPQKGVVWV